MEEGDDPYKILNVSYQATDEQIKKSYRRLAMENHPDRLSGDVDKTDAQRKFAKISNAYEILTDPDQRRQYDHLQEQQFKKTGKRKGYQADKVHVSFNSPYEVFKRDFQARFGFPYPGEEWDFENLGLAGDQNNSSHHHKKKKRVAHKRITDGSEDPNRRSNYNAPSTAIRKFGDNSSSSSSDSGSYHSYEDSESEKEEDKPVCKKYKTPKEKKDEKDEPPPKRERKKKKKIFRNPFRHKQIEAEQNQMVVYDKDKNGGDEGVSTGDGYANNLPSDVLSVRDQQQHKYGGKDEGVLTKYSGQDGDNRPLAMESTEEKITHPDGVVETITTTRMERPDGSVEVVQVTDKASKRPNWKQPGSPAKHAQLKNEPHNASTEKPKQIEAERLAITDGTNSTRDLSSPSSSHHHHRHDQQQRSNHSHRKNDHLRSSSHHSSSSYSSGTHSDSSSNSSRSRSSSGHVSGRQSGHSHSGRFDDDDDNDSVESEKVYDHAEESTDDGVEEVFPVKRETVKQKDASENDDSSTEDREYARQIQNRKRLEPPEDPPDDNSAALVSDEDETVDETVSRKADPPDFDDETAHEKEKKSKKKKKKKKSSSRHSSKDPDGQVADAPEAEDDDAGDHDGGKKKKKSKHKEHKKDKKESKKEKDKEKKSSSKKKSSKKEDRAIEEI